MSEREQAYPMFTPRAEVVKAEPMQASFGDEKPCPYCAEPIKAAAVKCRHCGEHFGTPTGNLQQPQVIVNNVIHNTNSGGAPIHIRSRMVAALLAFFFGGIGFHKFYIGKIGTGLLYLLFSWTFIPMLLGVLECISYLSYRNDEDFSRRACA